MQGLCTSSQARDISGARSIALNSRGVGVALLASRLASLTGVVARVPFARGLPVRDVIVGRRGSGCEKYHVVLVC